LNRFYPLTALCLIIGLVSGFLASYAIYQPQIQNLQIQLQEQRKQNESLEAENIQIKHKLASMEKRIKFLEQRLEEAMRIIGELIPPIPKEQPLKEKGELNFIENAVKKGDIQTLKDIYKQIKEKQPDAIEAFKKAILEALDGDQEAFESLWQKITERNQNLPLNGLEP
jgi:chromosome segregation ATPase